jgi:crotonobetainyl-CoA:carnitine CoA-transferase CaiB-like acyl-CoA transferase
VPHSSADLPLAGVRVIDFTNAVAGPVCSQILGDMGADVIKVESPTARSPKAHGAPLPSPELPDRPWNRLTNFNELNRSKRGLVLDVAKPDGRSAFLQLAAVSDIVVENFAPRVVGNLGIDYAAVRAVRPDIIYCSMPAFGKSGPYRDRISYGPGIDAMSGLSHLTGYEGGPPMKPGNFYCDYNAALLAAYSILAALEYRAKSGHGQYLEPAMIEGELQLIGEALLDVEMNGRVQARRGNRDTSMAPHNVYPCRPTPPAPLPEGKGAGGVGLHSDEWIAIAVGSDEEWAALCQVIDRPDLICDPRFADVVSRYHNQADVDPIIAAWTSQRDHYSAMRALQAAGVAAGAALSMVELLADPHFRARGVFRTITHPEQGPVPHTRPGFKLSRHPFAGPRLHAPRFGQDNAAILCDLLGVALTDLDALVDEGVVTDYPRAVG